MRLSGLMILLSMLSFASASIQNLGVYGQVYPIAEPNLLTFIHDKLLNLQASGKLTLMEQQVDARVTRHVLNPAPVTGIITAKVTHIFYFTPTFTLTHTVYNPEGRVLYPRGTIINPLDPKTLHGFHVPNFQEELIFINADDPNQVAFAKEKARILKIPFKIILISGNIKTASQKLGRIYFDQNGVLCHHFGITAVPAVLTRAGTHLKIEEVPVDA